MRINRYLASSGLASRRAAEGLILEGRVRINGRLAKLQDVVEEGDEVTLDDRPVDLEEKLVTLAYNKPLGVECTSDEKNEASIIKALNYPLRLFTVGRLDKNSEGLILLTNDGDLCYRLTKASEGHEKEYEVVVNKPIGPGFVSSMSKGVEILGTKTRPCKVVKTGERSFRIVLLQGLNRQIRRMAEALGYKVVSLKRLRIDRLELGSLKTGQYRLLKEEEIRRLFDL